jgi:hypothetical protein
MNSSGSGAPDVRVVPQEFRVPRIILAIIRSTTDIPVFVMRESRVPVENPNDEAAGDRGRCQERSARAMTGLTRCVANGFLVEVAREVVSRLTKRGNNPLMHPSAFFPTVLHDSAMMRGGSSCLNSLRMPQLNPSLTSSGIAVGRRDRVGRTPA